MRKSVTAYLCILYIYKKLLMENQELLDSNLYGSNGLTLSAAAKDFLLQTAKWAKFLSIVSFVFSGLMLLFGALFGVIMSKFSGMAMGMGAEYPTTFVTIYVIVLALIMIYPTLRLFQFAQQAKVAVSSNDANAMEQSMRRIRSVFRFYGILIIIILALYVFVILFSIIVGASGFMQ